MNKYNIKILFKQTDNPEIINTFKYCPVANLLFIERTSYLKFITIKNIRLNVYLNTI